MTWRDSVWKVTRKDVSKDVAITLAILPPSGGNYLDKPLEAT